MSNNHHLRYKKTKRLDFEANTREALVQYLFTRSRQLLWLSDLRLKDVVFFEWGGLAYFRDSKDKVFNAIYLYKDYQGKGLYPRIYYDLVRPNEIVTLKECNILGYLNKKDIPYTTYSTEILLAYKTIEEFYGNTRAKRSNILYMNHIDEGLYILQEIGAKEAALNAFALHPIFQDDTNLQTAYYSLPNFRDQDINSSGAYLEFFMLALEYRNIANQYLSKRVISSLDEIRLSPLHAVNQMLVADKIQNQKDFYLAQEKHPRYKELEEYFSNWVARLNIKNSPQFTKIKRELEDLDTLERRCLGE